MGRVMASGPECVTRHNTDVAFSLVLLCQVGNDGEMPVLGGKQTESLRERVTGRELWDRVTWDGPSRSTTDSGILRRRKSPL